MTRTLLVVSTFAARTMGSIGAANAVDYGAGPGGEHGRANRHNSYNYSDNCRNQFIYWTDQFGEHAVPKRDCEEGY
jgi:hypothetical protein